MQCINCNAEIPPQFVSAIQNNICPGCGKNIMAEEYLQVFNEIKSAILSMKDQGLDTFAQGIVGWLLSNYKLTKIGTAEPVNFHTAKNKQDIEMPANIKIADNPVQQMLKRAGMKDKVATSRAAAMAKLAEQINNDNPSEEEVVNQDMEILAEEEEDETPPPVIKVSSALASVDGVEVDPGAVNVLEKALFNTESEDANSYKNIQRIKRLKSQSGIDSGSGGFRRS